MSPEQIKINKCKKKSGRQPTQTTSTCMSMAAITAATRDKPGLAPLLASSTTSSPFTSTASLHRCVSHSSTHASEPWPSPTQVALALGRSCANRSPSSFSDAHPRLNSRIVDYEKRVHFGQWWVGLHSDSHKWLIATDEAYFYLTESINKQQSLKYTSHYYILWMI